MQEAREARNQAARYQNELRKKQMQLAEVETAHALDKSMLVEAQTMTHLLQAQASVLRIVVCAVACRLQLHTWDVCGSEFQSVWAANLLNSSAHVCCVLCAAVRHHGIPARGN